MNQVSRWGFIKNTNDPNIALGFGLSNKLWAHMLLRFSFEGYNAKWGLIIEKKTHS